MKKVLLVLANLFFIFSPLAGSAQETETIVDKLLNRQGSITAKNGWHITSEHVSSTSKIHHVYYQQVKDGILVRGTESSIHLSSKGDVIFEDNQFVKDVSVLKTVSKSSLISPKNAVLAVVDQMNYKPTADFSVKPQEKESLNTVVFSDGGISDRDISVKLIYSLDNNLKYQLVWEVSVLELDYLRWMNLTVDAVTGAIITSENMMQSCATVTDEPVEEALDYNRNLVVPTPKVSTDETANTCDVCYEVFAIPFVSPLMGNRTIAQNPADPIASPFGWHDTDGQEGSDTRITEGNNTSVVEKGDHRGYQTSGGDELDFTGFMFSPVYTTENQSEDAALTNVFYWNNIIHDVTFNHGFDEVSGNFQEINYNSGSRNNSAFEARIQTRRGCNAFFALISDRPIMILSYCEDKDASFDSSIIAHEYGHGIVSQLIGGSIGSSSCLNTDEQMTEGWADYLGVILTMDASDVAEDRRTIGNYFFGQGLNGRGIRRYPYSTDFSVNPQTYDYIKTSTAPHGVGSVWTTMLWEMTWALIDEHGFDPNLSDFTGDINKDAGNIMALAIVIEGMKLMSCNPGFIDARNAILQASEAIYGLDNNCIVYNAFARRGLGLYADQGDPFSKEDGTQSFEEYPMTAQILEGPSICYKEGIITGLSGGIPVGGVYSGNGVIDDGNGKTFSINTTISGAGGLLLSYAVGDSFCTSSSVAEREIHIDFDEIPPLIGCPIDIEETIEFGNAYILTNYIPSLEVSDNCTDEIIITQEPESYTELAEGSHRITLTATDEAGNSSSCFFMLNIKFIGDESFEFLTTVLLYPVPSSDEVIIYNPTQERILSVYIRDVNGRIIKSLTPRSKDLRIPIAIDQFSSGNYFITIVGDGDTIVRRMTKI
jgi:extracellular elastinolytic metalloproteinase